jgi:hypothetical protein
MYLSEWYTVRDLFLSQTIRKIFLGEGEKRKIDYLKSLSQELNSPYKQRWLESIERLKGTKIVNASSFPQISSSIRVREICVDEIIGDMEAYKRSGGLRILKEKGMPELFCIFYEPAAMEYHAAVNLPAVERLAMERIAHICDYFHHRMHNYLRSYTKWQPSIYSTVIEKNLKNDILFNLSEHFPHFIPYTILEMVGNQIADEYIEKSYGKKRAKDLIKHSFGPFYNAYLSVRFALPEDTDRILGIQYFALYYLGYTGRKLSTKELLEKETPELIKWVHENIIKKSFTKKFGRVPSPLSELDLSKFSLNQIHSEL